MAMKILRFLPVFFMLAGTYSCSEKSKQNLMPPITGKAGEVVLVMEKGLYDGYVGDSIFNLLTREEIALPQTGMDGAEPIFDLVPIPPEAFTNVFKSHRNIIIAKINPELSQAVIKVETSYWASQQVLIRLEAPNKEEFVKLLDNKEDFIVETIRNAEIERQVLINRKYENSELHRSILANHDIITYFPKGYDARVDTGNFVWVQHDPMDMIQGVLIWYYPYENEDQLSYEQLVSKQDLMLKTWVPGDTKDSYMAIYFGAPIHSKTFEHKGHFVREIKGLWEMEKGFMGGPFISWTLVDEPRNRVVTLFGFVYAPKYEKRNHIRKVESLIRTVDFPD